MLRIKHLSCGYDGIQILHDVSFQVRNGEFLCILGPNGCGKTTLLRSLSGILPGSGTMKLAGEDLRTLSVRQRAQKLSLMSQLSPAAFSYTVRETVMLGRYAHRRSGIFVGETEEDRRIVETCLTLTDTLELQDRPIDQLSGGQLQRVFLARTFAQDPQVILLDEPTNHLDIRYQVELVERLRNWAAVGGRCVVGVLHDINLALAYADTVLLLNQGAVQACERTDRLDLRLLDELYDMDVSGHMQNIMKPWR